MSTEVIAYEPLYKSGQSASDRVLAGLDWFENPRPDWREFAIYIHLFRQGRYLQAAKTGLFSPKFRLKTMVAPADFLAFAQTSGDVDVCFINAFPQLPYYSYNQWMEGECAHPGITHAAQILLDEVGIPWDLTRIHRQDASVLCYSNFWVGSPRFWEQYVGGILLPIAKYLDENPNSKVAKSVMLDTIHTTSAPFLPFIIERLFSTFLTLTPHLTFRAWVKDKAAIERSCLNVYERKLFEGMYEKITKADEDGIFSAELIRDMALHTALAKQYVDDYYAVHKHPHTGEVMKASA